MGKNPEKHDPWALPELQETDHVKFKNLSATKKAKRIGVTALKILILLGLLYMFVCSLSFLSSAFRLLGGKSAGKIFQNNVVLSNPIAGLMIGVISTVLVQSSSTSTSIVVAMVSASLIPVEKAVYIIMGANIGTSVTNTIVSLFHGADRNEFRRAFAAATVHDMFNWLSVIVLLPLEAIVGAFNNGHGPLFLISEAIVGKQALNQGNNVQKVDFLKKLTNPFTKKIIQLDKSVINALAKNESVEGKTMAKHICGKGNHTYNCEYLLNINPNLSDEVVGIILLTISLIILCVCLVSIVKLLHSMLQGPVARAIRKTVNSDFPGVFHHFTGYFAMLVGCILTFLVQSSSIFTSSLTPLVAVGVLTLDRTYPLTLGSNIGTTGTALLAALASDNLQHSLQIALCHLFFNVFGIILWYPVPLMRKVPINLAKSLGNTTARYRWFALVYLISMFFLAPLMVLALSIAGLYVLIGFGSVFGAILLVISAINFMQKKKPEFLPKILRNWNFLPKPLHSLEPYDKLISGLNCCRKCTDKIANNTVEKENVNYEQGKVGGSFALVEKF